MHAPCGRWAVVVLLSIAMVASGVWYIWRSWTAPQPPSITLVGADPELVEAIAAARSDVLRAPRALESWSKLAKLLRASEHLDEAVVCFGHAERLDPAEPRWPYLAGEALARQNKHQEALSPLARAAHLSEAAGLRSYAPFLRWADALLASGQPDAAEPPLRRALELEPDHPNVHLALAQLARAREQWDQVDQHLQRCLHSPFTQRKACGLKAEVCQRRGDRDLAAEFGRRALDLAADSQWIDDWVLDALHHAVGKTTRLRMCDDLMILGKPAEALRVLTELAEAGPDYRVRISMARVFFLGGEHEQAQREFQAALTLEPDSVTAHYYLSRILWLKGESLRERGQENPQALEAFRAAVAAARKALVHKPDHAQALMILGLCLERLGQREAAVAALAQAVHCAPGSSTPALHLGELLLDAGRIDQARPHLERALRFALPDDPRPKAALQRLAGKTPGPKN